MKRNIKEYKQELQSLVFIDKIARSSRQSFFSLKVKNHAGKTLLLNTDNLFKIDQKNNELEFQKKKHYDNFGELTYGFDFYTKGSLFAISDESLQAKLSEIFEREKCDNILGSELLDSRNESSFYYTTNVDFETIKKEYKYENLLVQKNIANTAEEIEKDEMDNVLSIVQKEIFYAIILRTIESKAAKYFSDVKERNGYILKSLDAIFGTTLFDESDMNVEKILDISLGAEHISDIIKNDYPLKTIKELYEEDKFIAGEGFGEFVRQIVNGNILFGNFNISNYDVINQSISENFQYCKQFYIPVFDSIESEPENVIHIKKDSTEKIAPYGEAFYNASMINALEAYHRRGSPAYLQKNGMFAFQKITKKEDIKNSIVLEMEDNTNLILIKGATEQETEQIAEALVDELRGSEKSTIPVKMDNGGILFTLKNTSNIHNGSFLNDPADMSLVDYKKFMKAGIDKNNFYSIFSSSMTFIPAIAKRNILNGLKFMASNTTENTNIKHINTFVNFLNKKVLESSREAPREQELLDAANKLKNHDMSFLSGITNIDKKDKVFPDIINIDASSKMSLEDISTSLFHISRWLMIPEYRQVIKEQLEKNNYVVPDIQPYKFSLTDPSKNILPDDKKQSIVSTKSHAGILNFQILPTIIEIDSKEDVDKFLEFSAKAIAFPYIELLGEEVFEQKAKDIERNLKTKYSAELLECKYVFTKITSAFYEGIVKKIEKFVALDENLNEKMVFNTPVFDFYSILQKEGMLHLENRMKNSSFKSSDIDEIFNGISKYIKSIEKNNSALFDKIDKMFLPAIESAIEKSEKFSFSITNKIALVSAIQKRNGKFFSEEMMENTASTISEKADDIFLEHQDEKSQMLKKALLDFYATNLKGKEFYLLDPSKESRIRDIFIERFGEFDYRVRDFYNLIVEKSAEVNKTLEHDIKIITLRAFSKHVERKANKGLTTEAKNEIINEFLYKVLGLQPHQALEVKGFLALHMRDEINVELLFWEMRTKKTRTMIAMLLLASLIKKNPSVFFLQNKNYNDIVGQAFDMLPFIVSDSSILLGANVNYKAEEAKLPAVLTDFIFPNIVSFLKPKKVLKNPKHSMLAPADILAENYTNVFYRIYEACKANPKQMLHDGIIDNMPDYPEFSFYKDISDEISDEISDATLKGIVTTTYFYVIKLFHEGFLNKQDVDVVADTINKRIKSFVTEYNKARQISSVTDEKPAKIVFAGKQFIDTFVASEDQENKIRVQNSTKDVLFTSLDVEVDLDTSEKVKKEIPVFELQQSIKSNVKFDNDIQNLVDKNLGVLFMNNFSKADEDYISTINKNIYKSLEDAFDKYATTIVDNDIKTSFYASYRIFKKMISLPITNAMKDIEHHQKFIESDLYEIATIKYNDKPIKPTCVKIDSLFAEKIQKSLPQVLVDMGAFEDPNDAKELVADMLFSQNIPNIVANSISRGSLEILMDRIYFRKKGKTNSINKAITALYPVSNGQTLNKIDVVFNVEPKYESFLGVSRTRKGEDDISYFKQSPIVLKTEVLDKENPSFFKNVSAIPVEFSISQEKGKNPTIHINRAIDFADGIEIGKVKKDTKKLSSSYLWELQEKEIGAISIDEAHKNISGNKKVTTSAILKKITNIFPSAIQIISTGTPNKHGEFIEVVSGNIGEKTKRTIDKYCGIYEMESLLITAILERLKTDSDIVNGIDSIIIDFSNSIKDEPIDMISGIYSRRLEEFVESSSNIMSLFAALSEIKNSKTSTMTSAVLYEIVKKIARSKKIKSGLSKGEGVKLFENTILEPKNKFVKKIAGVTNPIGLSEIFRFFINSNLSIKRPAGGVSYDIIDKEKVEIFGQRSLYRGMTVPTEKGKALEVQYLFNKKVYNTLAGNEIYRMYELLFSVAEQGLQENCEAIFGFELPRFNELCNRSEKSVEDSLKDIFLRRIKSGKSTYLSPDREDVYRKIIETVKYLQEHKVGKMVGYKPDASLEIKLGNGFSTVVDASIVAEAKKINKALSLKNIFYDPKTALTDKRFSIFQLTNNGVEVSDFEKSIVLRGEIDVSYEIDANLPPVETTISLSSSDDASIIEALAHGESAIELATKHLDKGENTRHMTTRIALTEAALLFAISAGAKRDNKEVALNIVASISDKGISAFVDKIIDTSKGYLKDNNINIIKTSSKNFNVDCASALNKKEQLSVVGNYFSLAEGIAMDFIQVGFYHGALDNISASIQSFARQTGHLQQQSRFYLVNDGNLSSLKGRFKDIVNFKHICNFYNNISIDETTAQQYLYTTSVFNKLERTAPYTGYRNNSIMEHFKAYELVMTGDFAYLREEITEEELENKLEKLQNVYRVKEIEEGEDPKEEAEVIASPSV